MEQVIIKPGADLVPESSYVYIAVRGSLHATYSSVFGLNSDEKAALLARYEPENESLYNGISIKGHALNVINSLSELGYRVVSASGENETTWTLEREA